MKKINFNRISPYIIILLAFYSGYKLEEAFMILYLIYNGLREKIINIKIDYKILGIVITISIISIMKAKINDYPLMRTYEQIILIGIMFLGYSHLFKKHGVKKLTNIYMDISFWVSFLGVLQFVIFFLIRKDFIIHPLTSSIRGIPQIFPGIIRARSIGYEPGIIAQTLVPAMCLSLTGIMKSKSKRRRKKYLTIIAMFILTFSSGAYVAIPFYFIFKEIKRKRIMKSFISIIGVFIVGLLSKNVWYDKVNDTLKGFSYVKTGIFRNLNASSFSILSNLYVALHNKNFYFGTGLGTHPYSYFENFKNRKNIPVYHFYGLNAPEAYSVFTRSLSEIGFIFVFLFICGLIYKFNNKQNYKGEINAAALTGIISYFMRGGLYTRFGTTFIILMYFYSERKKYGKKSSN